MKNQINTPVYHIEQKNAVITLFCNDMPCVCPFKTAAPMAIQPKLQGQPPEITFINQECNSTCPHFAVSKNFENRAVKIFCTQVVEIILHKEEINHDAESPENNTNNIIKL